MLVYLGLGSNKGNRVRYIKKALQAVKDDPRFKLMRVSRFYTTSPVGPKQRDFVNAAAILKTNLKPRELLSSLKILEEKLGRKKAKLKWGPRVIDLDILFYGKRVMREKGLEIPHPEIASRLFVLEPLCDISPDLKHPAIKKTVRKLRDALRLTRSGQKVKILK